MNLVSLIESNDLKEMADYIYQRFDLGISNDHAAAIFAEIAIHYDPLFHAEDSLAVRLKECLRRFGYLQPMFTGKDDDPKVTWNELHIFVDQPPEQYGEPTLDESEYPRPKPEHVVPRYDIEPNYVRSKLSEYGANHRPRGVNKTAHRVATIPENDDQP